MYKIDEFKVFSVQFVIANSQQLNTLDTMTIRVVYTKHYFNYTRAHYNTFNIDWSMHNRIPKEELMSDLETLT